MTVRALVSHLVGLVLLSTAGMAQQPIGTVGVQDATVAGALEVTNGRAVLVGNTTVTAKDHTAEVTLARGGKVLVCSTSGLHVTAGKSASGELPLLLSLDRGAIEVQMTATGSDIIMTPDLRFVMSSAGPLDLKLRVTRYGDTCVENAGANAPTLRIADQFGDTTYELHAGQHVLFEHANLKEVVDRESSPCGCPPQPVVSVADAGTTSATGSPVEAQQAAAQHPFPAAVSQGLAPVAPPPAAPAGAIHTQVAATLTYSGAEGAAPSANSAAAQGSGSSAAPGSSTSAGSAAGSSSRPASVPLASSSAPAIAQAPAPPPPEPPSGRDLAHTIGHFFKRLFGKG